MFKLLMGNQFMFWAIWVEQYLFELALFSVSVLAVLAGIFKKVNLTESLLNLHRTKPLNLRESHGHQGLSHETTSLTSLFPVSAFAKNKDRVEAQRPQPILHSGFQPEAN